MTRLMTLALLAGLAVAGTARADDPVVVVETSLGTFEVQLFEKDAPTTVKNFLSYVDDKFYDNTIFHRVISDFMVQGGGFETGGKEKKTKAAIKNESYNGLSNKKYTLAMARTDKPDSATSQFFVNVEDNDRLDKVRAKDRVGYCVFGKVIKGTDVVEKIKAVKTDKGTLITEGQKHVEDDVPVEEVVIKSIKLKK